jgi:hypothetical protein
MELEKRLTKVENGLKSLKEEARKEVTAKEEETKRPNETTKDMVARWMKDDGDQGCFKNATKK